MENNKDMFDYLKPRRSETPESSYFKQLAESVIDSQKTKVIPFYKKTIAWVSAAAACIAILVTVQLSSNNTTNDVLLSLDTCSIEEIEKYVADNIDDFDTELISEFIPVNSITPLEYTNAIEIQHEGSNESLPIEFDNINNDDILDYFESQNYDLEDIEDLLI